MTFYLNYLPYVVAGCALASFLIGSLPFGYWVGLAKGVDIRTLGSKNIGFTNVLRVLGPGPGALVMVLDVLKGVAGILIARQFIFELASDPGKSAHPIAMPFLVLIGLCAVLGHTFSPFLKFKGGKGISTSLGILLALSWQVGLIALGVWILFVAVTRYVSLASLLAALSLPISSYLLLKDVDRISMLVLTIALLILVTVKHRANIGRLLNGTEPKFGQRVATPTPQEEAAHE
ncbi:MAG: glycerol-3-phosphate 1-O-acyltransferase PlsY [Armatimonadota bacterium]